MLSEDIKHTKMWPERRQNVQSGTPALSKAGFLCQLLRHCGQKVMYRHDPPACRGRPEAWDLAGSLWQHTFKFNEASLFQRFKLRAQVCAVPSGNWEQLFR